MAPEKKSKIQIVILGLCAFVFRYVGLYIVLSLFFDFWRRYFISPNSLGYFLGLFFIVLLSGFIYLLIVLDNQIAKIEKLPASLFLKKMSGFLRGLKVVKAKLNSLFYNKFSDLNYFVFSYALVFYLVLLLVNAILPAGQLAQNSFFNQGLVGWFLAPATLRLSWLAGFVAIMGAVAILMDDGRRAAERGKSVRSLTTIEAENFKNYLFGGGLAVLGGLLVFFHVGHYGLLAYLAALAAASTIWFFNWLIL